MFNCTVFLLTIQLIFNPGGLSLHLGPAPQTHYELSVSMSIRIINHLHQHYPTLKLHQYTAPPLTTNSITLLSSCWDHHYVVVHSKHYVASHFVQNPRSSLIEANIEGIRYCGELIHILSFSENLGAGPHRIVMGIVKWFTAYMPRGTTVWDSL